MQTASKLQPAATSVDFTAIKRRQQATWASGDFAVVGTTLQSVGEALIEAVELRADERVLDVAAGNGNATLAAARHFARVTSTDYVQHLLDKGAARAAAEGAQVDFQLADAEALPFADGSFDVVLSAFGVMFAPDQPQAAAELLRTTRSGGRIGLANWTPDSFIGQVLRTVGAYVPPPPGVQSPALWGRPARIEELFASGAREIHCVPRVFKFRYRSAAHWLQVFRDYYGPTHKAFAALDQRGQELLQQDLQRLLDRHNTAGPDSLIVPSEYLEVVITKQ